MEQLVDVSLGRRRLPAEDLDELRRYAAAADRGTPLRLLTAAYLSSSRRVRTDLPNSLQVLDPQDIGAAVSARRWL